MHGMISKIHFDGVGAYNSAKYNIMISGFTFSLNRGRLLTFWNREDRVQKFYRAIVVVALVMVVVALIIGGSVAYIFHNFPPRFLGMADKNFVLSQPFIPPSYSYVSNCAYLNSSS